MLGVGAYGLPLTTNSLPLTTNGLPSRAYVHYYYAKFASSQQRTLSVLYRMVSNICTVKLVNSENFTDCRLNDFAPHSFSLVSNWSLAVAGTTNKRRKTQKTRQINTVSHLPAVVPATKRNDQMETRLQRDQVQCCFNVAIKHVAQSPNMCRRCCKPTSLLYISTII